MKKESRIKLNGVMLKIKAFFMLLPALLKRYCKLLILELILFVVLLTLDLVSKYLINVYIPKGSTVTLIPDFLEFYNTHNYGVSFGGLAEFFGENDWARTLLCVFSGMAIVAFIYFMCRWRGAKLISKVSMAMIIAGSLGNLIDRIAFDYVRDFIKIVYFGLDIEFLAKLNMSTSSFAIFNVADACLVVGIILFAVYFIFMFEKDKKRISLVKEDKAFFKTNFYNKLCKAFDAKSAALTAKGREPAEHMPSFPPPPVFKADKEKGEKADDGNTDKISPPPDSAE